MSAQPRQMLLDPGFELTLRPMRYPQFYDMYRNAIKNTWTVEEINFQIDISDLHGNPCITGKFVTNAPAYLTDLIGLGALGVAGQAYSEAQRTTYSGMQGSSSTITGSAGSYALGQAVAGGTNEVSKWLLQRLKNSFDAVITPSGHQLVVHLDREIQIDKAPNARKLIHRKQGGLQLARGEHHGLE